jgi:hypothetical protein
MLPHRQAPPLRRAHPFEIKTLTGFMLNCHDLFALDAGLLKNYSINQER